MPKKNTHPVPKQFNFLITLGPKLLPYLHLQDLDQIYTKLIPYKSNKDTFVCFHPKTDFTEDHIHIVFSVAHSNQKLQKIFLFLKKQFGENNIKNEDSLKGYLKHITTQIQPHNTNKQLKALFAYPKTRSNSDWLGFSKVPMQKTIHFFGRHQYEESNGQPEFCFADELDVNETLRASGMAYVSSPEPQPTADWPMQDEEQLEHTASLDGDISKREESAREKWELLHRLICQTRSTTIW